MNFVAVANASLSGVRYEVRTGALGDLHYFVEHVLGLRYCETLCEEVQEAVEERYNCSVRASNPQRLAGALHAWLVAQGYNVLCSVPPTQHDMLLWLGLEPQAPTTTAALTLEVTQTGLVLQWL